jgi:MOSC domain-containing protein YiiM
MRLVSLNVALPRTITIRGQSVETGIFKTPVTGPQTVSILNVTGDGQADLTVHGGIDKAIYGYPVEHYPYWQDFLGRTNFTYGQFGENLTTEGLLEDAVHIGDQFRVGTAVLQVSQPRVPCFKLGIRMNDPRSQALPEQWQGGLLLSRAGNGSGASR